ncbi:diacylglycerol acyltransferase-domain-containing protein [Kalaharituber pfeilii]|nr:diacylglycerol acyltransferase-domain-containing protein [Kalaharituber pfeilii]
MDGIGGEAEVDGHAVPPAPSGKKKRGFRIRFAPLCIPLRRRLQTLAVLWHVLALGLFLTVFWSSCFNPLMWPILPPYLLHLLLSSSHHNGASPYIRSSVLRSLPIWRYYNAYFPIRIIRTAKLSPERNYIFGYQPHGIISLGAWGAFVTDSEPAPTNAEEGNESECRVMPGGSFSHLFPGIRNTLLTLDGNFRIPIYREYMLSMGLASVSRRSCEALLSGGYARTHALPSQSGGFWSAKGGDSGPGGAINGRAKIYGYLSYISPIHWLLFIVRLFVSLLPVFLPSRLHSHLPGATPAPTPASPAPKTVTGGNAITIVVGGAHEALLTLPNTTRLILRRRLGFLKLALRHPNTSLVPVLAFGENDAFETMLPEKGSWLHRLQHAVKKWMGWTVPMFAGRGVFNYDVGFVPFRVQLNVVVGREVTPRRWREWREGMEMPGEPADEEVRELQEEYVDELMRIWEEWKDKLAPNRDGDLEIVE